MLSTLAVLFIRSFRNVPIARGNVIVSLYLIVIYGVLMLDYFGVLDFDILTVNIITFIFIVVYALAVRHLSGETEAPNEDCQEEVGLSLNQIIVRFIIASIAIIGLSIVLTYITDDIAQRTISVSALPAHSSWVWRHRSPKWPRRLRCSA